MCFWYLLFEIDLVLQHWRWLTLILLPFLVSFFYRHPSFNNLAILLVNPRSCTMLNICSFAVLFLMPAFVPCVLCLLALVHFNSMLTLDKPLPYFILRSLPRKRYYSTLPWRSWSFGCRLGSCYQSSWRKRWSRWTHLNAIAHRSCYQAAGTWLASKNQYQTRKLPHRTKNSACAVL